MRLCGFEKAFDRVHRATLFFKLGKAGLRGKMFKMLHAIYSEVKTCVLGMEGLSAFFECEHGVRQGCILSPFLFTFFLNDMHKEFSMNTWVSGCTIGLVQIFYLLFADDLVLIAETKIKLQRLLNELDLYCTKHKLTVNLGKTNIVVFRRGGRLRNYEKWFYRNQQIKVVSYFKYLGVVLSCSGLWSKAQLTLAEQAAKALFSVISQLKAIGDVPIRICFKIFDSKISPILSYCCEVWGYIPAPDIERIQYKFCKILLRQNSSVVNLAARGELGRYSMRAMRLPRIAKYWLRLLKSDSRRYIHHAYQEQCKLAERDVECWAKAVSSIFFLYGFEEAWYNQGVGCETNFLSEFKQRCRDIDLQQWNSDISTYSRLESYRLFMSSFTIEPYLLIEMKPIFKSTLTAFRLSNHVLNIEQGRRKNIERQNRLCPCNDGILLCSLGKYLPEQYHTNPSIDKFIQLMSTQNTNILRKLSCFLFHALKKRKELTD